MVGEALVWADGMKKFKAVIPFDAATNTPIMSYIMYDSLDHRWDRDPSRATAEAI